MVTLTAVLSSHRGPTRPPIARPSSTRARHRFRRQFRVRRFAGPLCHADQLDHLRVAHLTDLHVGAITPMQAQLAGVALAKEAQPDLVVITGDFVCHSQAHLASLTEVIRAFDLPVFCVMGNHDHWSGAGPVRRALRRAGAEVLDNAWTLFEARGQRLQIVGLDDAYTGAAERRRAIKGLRRDRATLGLSHIAEEADGLWAAGVPLVLSGHTHAGQITVAKLHEISVGRIAGHKYVHGLYGRRAPRDEGPRGAVYVGAGVGAAVVGLRLGERARREVTIFELGQPPGGFEEHHDEQPAHPGRRPTEKKKRLRAEAVRKKALKRERRRKK